MSINGITINDKNSFVDFNIYIAEKKIEPPNKQSIVERVPFQQGFYDFSNMLGFPTFEDRTIMYKFDIVAEDLESEKNKILNWLFNVNNANIYDDDIQNYHFKGSFYDYSYDEDENYAELTVVFLCYPFKIANLETIIDLTSGENIITDEFNSTYVDLYLKSAENNQDVIINNNTTFTLTTEKTKMPFNFFDTIKIECTEDAQMIYRREVF